MPDRAVAARLAKLLRLLASNHEGEVVAAAGKISGLVAAHDIDWDEILTGTPVELTREQMERLYQSGYQAGYQKGVEDGARIAPASRDDWASAGTPRTEEVGSQLKDVAAILEAAGRAGLAGKLSEFERTFSISIAERINDWGSRAYVSERQWGVLNRLKNKLQREGYL